VKKDVAYAKEKIKILKEDLEDVKSDVKELKKGKKNTQTAVNSFVKFSKVSNCKYVERNAKNNLKRVERDWKKNIDHVESDFKLQGPQRRNNVTHLQAWDIHRTSILMGSSCPRQTRASDSVVIMSCTDPRKLWPRSRKPLPSSGSFCLVNLSPTFGPIHSSGTMSRSM
jgi:hypothetical protein